MGARFPKPPPSLEVIETVRCLECGIVYSKPSRGGIVGTNPGCPQCGYVGWLSASIPVTGGLGLRRSGADLQLLPNERPD